MRNRNVSNQLVSSVKLGAGTEGLRDCLERQCRRALVMTGRLDEKTNVARTVRSLRPSSKNCAARIASLFAASDDSFAAAADDADAVEGAAGDETEGAAAVAAPDSAAVNGQREGHIHLGIAMAP